MQINACGLLPPQVVDGYVAAGLWDDVTVRDGIEAWARRAPDRIAVIDATTSLTYAQLEEAIGRALGTLRAVGIGAGDTGDAGDAVVVLAPLSVPAVVAYSAVVRSGALAVLVDRRAGRSDLWHAAAIPGVRLIMSPQVLIEPFALPATGYPVVPYESLLSGVVDRGWPEPDPRAPAAVVFTSGTTSRPKAVLHSLNTLRSGARSMAEAFTLTAADAAFLSTPLASITGLLQTHLMLERGAALILEDRFDPARSLERLRAHGATVVGGAPVSVEQLFRQADAEGVQTLPLRTMALGGTMIPRPVLQLAIDRYGIMPVRMYGSSEIPAATGTLVTDEGEARLADDGAPARGVEVRTDGEIAGELLARGPMRCLGYLDERDNRAAFCEGGWFRTGDTGRVEARRLTVTGRLKEIIARKGLKISLAEIDDAARLLPGVEEAAAYGVPDPETGERLVLAVHAREPARIAFDDVIQQLSAGGLAPWKLPEQIVIWDGPLPRTGSGKIQRQLVAGDPSTRRTLLAPRLRKPD